MTQCLLACAVKIASDQVYIKLSSMWLASSKTCSSWKACRKWRLWSGVRDVSAVMISFTKQGECDNYALEPEKLLSHQIGMEN